MSVQNLPKRSEVPVELTWDLSVIYANTDAWEADFREAERLLPQLEQFKGTLTASVENLLNLISLRDKVSQIIENLFVYASHRADEDTTVSANLALRERARILSSKFGSAMSYVNPELLAADPSVLQGFLSQSSALREHEFALNELLRQRPHIRSAEVENVMAQAAQVLASPDSIYSIFTDAEMELPVIGDGKGNRVQLSGGNFGDVFRQSPIKRVRQRAHKAMFGTYRKFRNTLAATYAAQVNAEIFQAKVRGFASTREMRLFDYNIPVSVYDNLIATVHANIPVMTRYLKMRQKMLGLRKLNFCDLYVPLVAEVDYAPTYAQSVEKVLAAVAPLGKEYVDALRAGFNSRWVDVIENENKKSGAYSGGGHQTPPYMLMNWTDTLECLFTLAHEAGHSMHSWFTRKTQPYHSSNYTLFVAEVASTCNEALLAHFMIGDTADTSMKRFIINHQLEGIRTTLYRQTLFAEFEMKAHAKAEAGEILTADVLEEIYKELLVKYYGDAVELDEHIIGEWSYIPHFYSPFYVYQYATGISAAQALSTQILTEGEPAVKRYLNFLSSGGSKYSIDLLAGAGVDLSTPEPIEKTFAAFEQYLAEFEKLA